MGASENQSNGGMRFKATIPYSYPTTLQSRPHPIFWSKGQESRHGGGRDEGGLLSPASQNKTPGSSENRIVCERQWLNEREKRKSPLLYLTPCPHPKPCPTQRRYRAQVLQVPRARFAALALCVTYKTYALYRNHRTLSTYTKYPPPL